MRIKNIKNAVALLCLLSLLLCSVLLFSCADDDDGGEHTAESQPYDVANLSEHISIDAYTGLTVILESEDSPKGEAVWTTVLERARVRSYPDEQVRYYVAQAEAKYRHVAKQNGWEYEETLQKLGVTEESMISDAKEMVKSDMVYLYISQDAGIVLTDTEKAALFDRYADKFVQTYGYDIEYVSENMRELIYESMLYDKTMEYLIVNNSFETK